MKSFLCSRLLGRPVVPLLLTLTLALTGAGPAGLSPVTTTRAQEAAAPAAPGRVVVTGEAPGVANRVDVSDDPLASPSSVTVRTGEEIAHETIQSYGDLLRPVAGVSVSNYDQGALGYGVTLRGFDEGNHGGEVAYAVDGVPVNRPSSAVGFNGYANLAPLIPELVQDLAVYRGPFNPRFGDFALGGAVDIRTVARAPSSFLATGGSFGAVRGVGVLGLPDARGPVPLAGYTAFAADNLNGYRDHADVRSLDSFTRLETPVFRGAGALVFRAQVYSTDYGAAGYLNRSQVHAGAERPTDAANRYDGGSDTQLNFSTSLLLPSPRGDFTGTLYVVRDLLKRWSDFSLTRDDDGPQALQVDDRVAVGGVLEKSFRTDGDHAGGWRLPAELTLGISSRSDLVGVDTFTTVHRQPVARTGQVNFTQQNAGAYARLQLQPQPWLKLSFGTRYDHFFYDVGDHLNHRRVSTEFGTWSPKLGLAVSPFAGAAVFGNYGESLRSPDAIGDLLRNPNLRVAKQRSGEVGVSYDSPSPPVPAPRPGDHGGGKDAATDKAPASPAGPPPPTFHLLADAYYTNLSNDVVTGPDGFTPQNVGRSRRRGVEVEASAVLCRSERLTLSLFANYSYVEAVLVGGPVHQFVPDVAADHFNYGVDVDGPWLFDPGSPHRFHFSAYHQIIGPKHLTADGGLYTRRFTRLSAKLSYANRRVPGLGLFVGVVAYPDRRLDEVAFDFGGGQVGVSPKPLLNFQGGLSYVF